MSVRERPHLLGKCSSCLSVALPPLAGPQTHGRVVLENILPTLSPQGIAFQGFRVGPYIFQAWAGQLSWLGGSSQEGRGALGR